MKKLIFIGCTVLLSGMCSAQSDNSKEIKSAIDSAAQIKSGAHYFFVGVDGKVLDGKVLDGKVLDSAVDLSKKATDSAIAVKVDSAVSVAAPANTSIGPIKLPTWLLSLIATIIGSLPLIQFILKRIPTATSIKIQGWLGIILDAITWFQKDKSTTVSPSAPPPVQNGIEKPALRDLVNHK